MTICIVVDGDEGDTCISGDLIDIAPQIANLLKLESFSQIC